MNTNSTPKVVIAPGRTHRASFPVCDNDFVIETPQGELYDTATGRVPALAGFYVALAEHRARGFHSNCVICQEKERAYS